MLLADELIVNVDAYRNLVPCSLNRLLYAVAGVRGRTLIINLPGSPKGAWQCLEVVLPVLEHAVELLQGPVPDESHRPPPGWNTPGTR